MAEMITFEEFESYALRLAEKLSAIKSDVEELSANNAKGLLIKRVFGKGGTKDVNGAGLGGYGRGYAAERARKGRQTSNVDLQLTGKLLQSIQVGKSGSSTVLGFLPGVRKDAGKDNASLAAELEGRYGTEIFALNEEEAETVIKSAIKYIEKAVNL